MSAVSALVLVHAPAASALTLQLDLDYEFSGATAPSGPAPWVRLTFDDSFGDASTVRLTIDALGLTGNESVTGVYLNFDPGLDPTQLSFSAIDNADAPPIGIQTGADSFMADGDGFFDVLFDLAPPGSGNVRLTGGESIVYDLVYVAPITVASFDYDSVMGGGAGSYVAAAHIQAIGPNDESGWIGPVPEPGTGLLIGLGLLGASRRRLRA